MDFLKAEQLKGNKWRVLAIPYGGPFEGKDFDGEFFSPNTDIKPDWFDRRPLVWHHNLDETMKADPVLGTADDLEQTEEGWWVTMWLDRSSRYWAEVNKLLGKGKLYGSSGTIGHLMRKARDGEILQWPHVEQSLTPTPSNFFSVVKPAKAIDHFKSAGIASDDLESILADLDNATALGPDLPSGGDDPAMVRRQLARLAALDARLKTL